VVAVGSPGRLGRSTVERRSVSRACPGWRDSTSVEGGVYLAAAPHRLGGDGESARSMTARASMSQPPLISSMVTVLMVIIAGLWKDR
jgi:hypothetical protein